MLDRIDSEIIRMDRLIGELLTLSRLETSEIGVLDAEVCIDEVLDDIVDSAQFEAESAKKRFYFFQANPGPSLKVALSCYIERSRMWSAMQSNILTKAAPFM
ncbi:hypothetical protein ACFS07_22360 [Undibacterium arcticum]